MRDSCVIPSVPRVRGVVLWYGGSFDPPTVAHRDLPEAARAAIGAAALVYCPAARSPFKSEAPRARDADRVAMVAAMIDGRSGSFVSTLEIDRAEADEPSYTVDTLEEVTRRRERGSAVRLLIGEDQARSFHRWREAARIVELAEPVVMVRGDGGGSEMGSSEGRWESRADALADELARVWGEGAREAWRRRLVRTPVSGASATRARAALSMPPGGAREESLAGLLPPGVRRVIRERGLYGDHA